MHPVLQNKFITALFTNEYLIVRRYRSLLYGADDEKEAREREAEARSTPLGKKGEIGGEQAGESRPLT